MKQTEAVDFNNTENQNTSKEKMDMSDKMITLDRKDKNLIYENTEMRVFMYGIRDRVNGRKNFGLSFRMWKVDKSIRAFLLA